MSESLEALQAKYTKVTGKNLSPAYKNNKDWIEAKILEAQAGSGETDTVKPKAAIKPQAAHSSAPETMEAPVNTQIIEDTVVQAEDLAAENKKLRDHLAAANRNAGKSVSEMKEGETLWPFTHANGKIGLYRRLNNLTDIPPTQNMPSQMAQGQSDSPFEFVKWA